MHLILLVEWAVCVEAYEKIVVVSNDTDSVALLLHCTPYFSFLHWG